MNLKGIINVLIERYEANNGKKSLPAPYVVPLLAEPTDEQLKQLKEGDGNPIAEMCQINSSAGLAFNYYKLFESQVQKKDKDFKVKFEDKVAIPLCLKRGGKYANLDVSYCLNDTQYYIESKFLEPYLNKCTHNKDTYFEQKNYDFDPKEIALWLELLDKQKEFQYYDFPQLYRHLLAIRRSHNKQGKVVLQSVSWKMPDAFKAKYGLKKEDEERLEKLELKQSNASNLFNIFLKNIGWNDCRFEVKHYNDMLDDIRGAEKFNDFCKQYFLD